RGGRPPLPEPPCFARDVGGAFDASLRVWTPRLRSRDEKPTRPGGALATFRFCSRRPGGHRAVSLEGGTVLITGGTRGIGRAIALRLARERPRMVVVAYCRNHAAARQTLADLRALGVEADAISTDVGSSDRLCELFADVERRHGGLDVFVSNAARTSFRPAMELDARTWQQIMDLNARAFLLGAQKAARLMPEGGGGRI